jgi:hypothetical protein
MNDSIYFNRTTRNLNNYHTFFHTKKQNFHKNLETMNKKDPNYRFKAF